MSRSPDECPACGGSNDDHDWAARYAIHAGSRVSKLEAALRDLLDAAGTTAIIRAQAKARTLLAENWRKPLETS